MFDQDRYTKGKRVNFKNILRKEEAKMKRLQKEQERASRPPSCRLSKEVKKLIARQNIVLDQPTIVAENEEQNHNQTRVVLRKQKRKQGHRSHILMMDELEDSPKDDDETTIWLTKYIESMKASERYYRKFQQSMQQQEEDYYASVLLQQRETYHITEAQRRLLGRRPRTHIVESS